MRGQRPLMLLTLLAMLAPCAAVPVAAQQGRGKAAPPPRETKAAAAPRDTKPSAGSTTFAEAFSQGKDALDRMQQAAVDLEKPPTDPALLDALKRQKQESSALALKFLRQAVELADGHANKEDLASARYFLCWLAYDAGQYYDVGVLGEFLARNHVESQTGRAPQGALLAMAAYVRLAGDDRGGDKSFEVAKVDEIGRLLINNWRDTPEAEKAAQTLLNFYATHQQTDKVLALLERMPAESALRGSSEMRAGQMLWTAYSKALQEPPDKRPPQQELDQLKSQAQTLLSQGVTRLEKSDKVDATLTASVFALAQIALDAGDADKAITWLEHPKLGPLTLIKAKDPIAARPEFATATYRLALRAYIGAHPQQLKKAEEVMDNLEKLTVKAGDAKAAESLTLTYISLGRELEKQLETVRKRGNKQEVEGVSQAFDVFLDRVSRREPISFEALNWVAGTYFNMADAMEVDPATLLRSREFFRKAATTYQKSLDQAVKLPTTVVSKEMLGLIRLRLAECHRRGGDFDAATKLLLAVLREQPNLLAAQVQAAETYQAQGATEPAQYRVAIQGGMPGKDNNNLVWGWSKISRLTIPTAENKGTENGAKLEKTFHHARLKMAEARFSFATKEATPDKRGDVFAAAKEDLWQTYVREPEMGGPDTAAEYNKLLKQIQKAMGSPEVGLAEFREKATAAKTGEQKTAIEK